MYVCFILYLLEFLLLFTSTSISVSYELIFKTKSTISWLLLLLPIFEVLAVLLLNFIKIVIITSNIIIATIIISLLLFGFLSPNF